MKIGFIGLGIMGSRMAANLQKHGHELVVHNRTKSKADTLIANGAVWAGTPADVARQVGVLFTMLASPEAVEQMASGPDGFLKPLKPNSLWVDCSTVNPSFSHRMAELATDRAIRFVDAPVAGTRVPAEKGELVFYVGGEEQDVRTCQPFFDAMGSRTIHVGGPGMGISMKMVVNLVLGEAMLAFSEAMALGQSLGIESETLFKALIGGPVVAPFISSKLPKIESGNYQADFPLQWMHKDLHLVSLTGYERGVALPGANAAKEAYALAERAGLGGMDFSAIYRFINEELKA